VVAEGVETAEQAGALQAIGCESVQGFFYGYPVHADELWDTAASIRPDTLYGPSQK
jgi:EAL domain-containing protein (putative c-di-GMP-specific phosphodiesterase class I)